MDLTFLLLLSFLGQQPAHETRFLGRRERLNINVDFRDGGDSGQGIIPIEARNSVNQVEGSCEWGDEAADINLLFEQCFWNSLMWSRHWRSLTACLWEKSPSMAA